MRVRGEAKSAERIELRRKGAGKKELKPLRLERPRHVMVGVGRVDRSSTVRQLAKSPAGEMVTWMEQRAIGG
jgi:hypothetical protein